MPILRMEEVDLRGRRVLIREDLNVPIKGGAVANDARIRAALPTLRQALAAGARVMVMSHLGRPTEGRFEEKHSLAPVAERLGWHLAQPVELRRDWLAGVAPEPGHVVLCENVRFERGETDDDEALARRMASLCDVFVMDAFGTAHRAQASTHGVARYAPIACGGPLLMAELDALARALEQPARPLLAIVGGAKVSTKLLVLEKLCDLVDRLVVGGGIANTFIAAAGHAVGKSLYEPDLLAAAKSLAGKMRARGSEIPIPDDVVVATEASAAATSRVTPVTGIAPDEMVLDFGPRGMDAVERMVREAGTIIWNGPLGVFEHEQFGHGTRRLATAIAESAAFSLAGGGETLAAIDQYGVSDRISYISTGGGAFLEFLEGKTLPAVAILESVYRGRDGRAS